MWRNLNFIGVLFCLMCLQACQQTVQIKPSNKNVQEILVDLTEQESYQFDGKMSFSDGQDGGSGGISWQSKGGLISTQLKAPLSSKSWRIKEMREGAELTSNGSTVLAKSAQSLISDQLGWQVPWLQLKSWVTGRPHNNNMAQINWQSNGYTLTENGWQIEYTRLKEVPEGSFQYLPHKMVARKANYSIKLIVKQWHW